MICPGIREALQSKKKILDDLYQVESHSFEVYNKSTQKYQEESRVIVFAKAKFVVDFVSM